MNAIILTTSTGSKISKTKILKLLQTDSWLCDEIINVCLSCLEFGDINVKDTFYFTELITETERLSSPKWNEILTSTQTLALPVNLDYHWSLMVLRNNSDSLAIELWDSLPSKQRTDKITNLLLTTYNLFSIFQKKIVFFHKSDCYIQDDTDNCGVFLISNIITLISNKQPQLVEPDKARIAISLLILQSINSLL